MRAGSRLFAARPQCVHGLRPSHQPRALLHTKTNEWRLTAMAQVVPRVDERAPMPWRRTYTVQALTVAKLLTFASEGKTDEIRKMVRDGVKVTALSDYDKRTALHLAASEGRLETVKYLISIGAPVNAVDRFGGTPLEDAIQSRRSDIVEHLRKAGGQIATRTEDLTIHMCQAASIGNVQRLRDIIENTCLHSNVVDYDQRSPLHIAAANGQLSTVEYLLSMGADPEVRDRFGNTPISEAESHGYKDILDLLQNAPKSTEKEQDLDQVTSMRSSSVIKQHFHEVKDILKKSKIYSDRLILSELDWYYNHLEFPEFYFNRFSPEQVAKHVEAYIAAKQVAEANGLPENIRIDGLETRDGAFFLCPNDTASVARVEQQIEKIITNAEKAENEAVSAFHIVSRGTAIPHGTVQLSMYIVVRALFENPKADRKEKDLKKVASPHFFSWRKPQIIDQFQQVMVDSTDRISPNFHIMPPTQDGLMHIMFAHRRDTHHLPLDIVSQILSANGLTLNRKVIEQFSNGVSVHSMYFAPTSEEHLNRTLNDVSLMFIVRRSNDILPLYLSGELTAKEYAYCTTAAMFVYYYMFQDNEDLRALLQSLKHDPSKIARLENIRKMMKTEIVSLARIGQAINTYPSIVKEIVKHFEYKFSLDGNVEVPKSHEEITNLIAKQAENDQDREILEQFMLFNDVCLKTNFFKLPKTAISFRINPSFLTRDPAYPTVPFGVFMMIGNDFHGFHVRFNDVARGGIRLVLSQDKATFARNMESAFFENYNLAHTQNRKNKDIPEFGSKGVLLLRPRALVNPLAREQVFRKYISSMLDMLISNNQVKDLYGKEEILFLGPDENTADLMEWAALYAKKRGYRYWKAFTTGKPQSIGGIPHDIYGMTTQSVHQYVVEILKDANIREEDITKFQTGGPDGDLGSNEILISKDKTIGIVDGSGVVYNPEGLDRTELTRLAHARQTVKHYDTSLGDKGFKVLVSDSDVTLPDGRAVQSGLLFRNEFHLLPYSSADLFVPCGGRPEAVNSKNINRMFNQDGSPRFKYIVEGANLFFTQEARRILEDRGVILFKDASTNKGGVTSSSLEVLAALALNDEEHAANMCFREGEPVPKFYAEYVEEVQRRIRENALLEYRCLKREHAATGEHAHLLTDQLSDKINSLTKAIAESNLYHNSALRSKVLHTAIPAQLQQLVPGGLNEILTRLPENYTRAVFSTYLASRFVYSFGLRAGDFGFFEFMEDYMRKQ